MADAAMRESFRKEFYSHLLAHMANGIRWTWPMPPFYTGYEGGNLFDWDQYFEGLLQLYTGFPTTFMKNSLRIFLDKQQPDGFIQRCVSPGWPNGLYPKNRVMVKPFLAQIALLLLNHEGEVEWMRREGAFERLDKYMAHWERKLDRRGGGLSVWANAGHTGMDNHYERAGKDDASFCEGVDLNVYLVREARAMAILAEELGRPEAAGEYRARAEGRAKLVRERLWDEREGIFYDWHAVEDRPIKVKYVGAFLPMWGGIATPEQARRLVEEHLTNAKEFWRPWPIPALAATEPTYVQGFLPEESTGCCSWRAHTWVPTNYMVCHALRQNGYHELAATLAAKTFDLFCRGRFNEYFTSECGSGTGRKPFWGWTALALFMEPEIALGVDPTVLARENGAVRAVRKLAQERFGA